jgi:hypothetical protein
MHFGERFVSCGDRCAATEGDEEEGDNRPATRVGRVRLRALHVAITARTPFSRMFVRLVGMPTLFLIGCAAKAFGRAGGSERSNSDG